MDVFIIMIFDIEWNEVIECWKRFKFCFMFYIILFLLDKMVFYEVFYKVLEKNF